MDCCGESRTGTMPGMMSGMMQGMMGNCDEGSDMAEICQNMMRSVSDAAAMASHATPEVQALFDEWSSQVEQEILALLKSGVIDVSEIAESLSISEKSVSFFLSKLLRDNKIKITEMDVL